MALAGLARDCVSSGVERRALYLRLSLLPAGLRGPHHLRLVREALMPVLRPTRARLYELPGGDLAVLAPPSGDHLEEARRGLARLMPEIPAETLLPTLRLPAEAARLLTLVEATLGLGGGAPMAEASAELPPPSGAEMDAALHALASANLAAFLRQRTAWRLAPEDERATPAWTELRVHLPDVAAALLPGRSLAAAPGFARRFRHAAERRMLADLARPREARELGEACLPIGLGAVTEVEFLRLDAVLGPRGRGDLTVCLPVEDLLADPAGFAMVRELSRQRGWRLGLDAAEPGLLPLVSVRQLNPALIRLRFQPAMLSGDPAARSALDAALPEDRGRVVLAGADAPAAVAWAWQRGVTHFMGKLF